MKKIQKVQNEFIRTCLNLPKYVSINILHEASGLEMIQERMLSLAKKQFTRLKSQDNVKSLIENRHTTAVNERFKCKGPLDVLI